MSEERFDLPAWLEVVEAGRVTWSGYLSTPDTEFFRRLVCGYCHD